MGHIPNEHPEESVERCREIEEGITKPLNFWVGWFCLNNCFSFTALKWGLVSEKWMWIEQYVCSEQKKTSNIVDERNKICSNAFGYRQKNYFQLLFMSLENVIQKLNTLIASHLSDMLFPDTCWGNQIRLHL